MGKKMHHEDVIKRLLFFQTLITKAIELTIKIIEQLFSTLKFHFRNIPKTLTTTFYFSNLAEVFKFFVKFLSGLIKICKPFRSLRFVILAL